MAEKSEIRFDIVYVIFIPKQLEEFTLYISEEFGHITHICPCGCKQKIDIGIAPFWKDGWTMTENNGEVSLSPSLLNRFCGAHYFFRNNKIEWC